MYYQISEDEFNSLDSVCSQLGLISGLLSHIDENEKLSMVAASEFQSFIGVQKKAVAHALDSALKECQQGHDINTAVAGALADGRLLPAQEAWARDLGKTNMAALTAYIATAQPIAALTGTQATRAAAAGALPTDQRAVPHVAIAPELLIEVMNAAAGKTTDSDTLLRLWSDLYDAGVTQASYMGVLDHFAEIVRSNGLVLRVGYVDGHPIHEFVAMDKPCGAQPVKPAAVKARKREKLARVGT